jgi:hypothetical protein
MQGIDGRWHDDPPIAVRTPPVPPAPDPADAAADSEELRFTLKELFLATTVAAVMLALFRSIGIFGAVLSFLSAVILTLVVFPQLFPQNRPRQRALFDFVWGIVMPIVCLVFDPMVFKSGDFNDLTMFNGQQDFMVGGPMQINEGAYFAWPLLAALIVTLAIVLVWGKSLRRISSVLAGALGVGFLTAACLAIFLVFPAALGTFFFGIGLLGFTPIFTSYSYFRRMRVMWNLSRETDPSGLQFLFAALGLLLCVVLAGVIGYATLALVRPSGL